MIKLIFNSLLLFSRDFSAVTAVIIDCVALAKQGDNRIGSVRPSVCPFACTLLLEPFDLRP